MPEPESPRGTVTWAELGRALVRPSRGQLILAVILLLCGLALTMQLREDQDERYSSLRQEELVSILDDVSAESRRLEDEIAELESTKRQLESGVDASEVARAEATRRLEALELELLRVSTELIHVPLPLITALPQISPQS